MKVLPLLVFFVSGISLFSQGPVITPLKRNSHLNDYNGPVSNKRAASDTLSLPFFDDFTTTNVYPDMKMWRDSQVYINSHFPISPPSFGVATFDNLNKKGAPYRAMSGLTKGGSDTLTSKFINLKTYVNGSNILSYTLADSIYLSFFYQTQGIGDPLDASDTLFLQFKDQGGDWRSILKIRGSALKPFKQVMVGIKDTKYLTPGFQFRFINYGKNTGNMNQWHLDYVRMNKNRSFADTVVDDVAINAVPIGPLKVYETMPYDHFLASSGSNTLGYQQVQVRNNSLSTVNVTFTSQVRDQSNALINTYPSSGINVPAQSDTFNKFTPAFTMTGQTVREPVFKMKFNVSSVTNDKFLGNNEYTKNVYFKNYYAYDDGSAEGGYGLDYGSLPAGNGYSAMKFQLFKGDTLGGISIFFNRSVADVTFKPFTLMVWQNITEPPANNTNSDVVLKKVNLITTLYADSINGFVNIIFDTALVLPAGNFYLGWQQTSNYILNVGYDNNYKYQHQGGRNPNLFYNLNGYWEKVASTITGVPMIRPLFGGKLSNNTAISRPSISSSKVMIYPNPSGNSSVLMMDSENEIVTVKVLDVLGKVCMELHGSNMEEIDISQLSPGFYQVMVSDIYKQTSIHKYIKN